MQFTVFCFDARLRDLGDPCPDDVDVGLLDGVEVRKAWGDSSATEFPPSFS